MSLRIGADIGGTFTDLVFLRPDGRLDRRKVPSTPDDYGRAITDGIAAYRAEQLAGEVVDEVAHATTVATNAILERRGARTALLTTEGFRDVLELRRIRIPLSYDLGWQKPPPLVPRAYRLPVRERVDAAGNVLIKLDTASLDTAMDEIAAGDIEAIAVCLLHSYRAPRHEQEVGAALRRRFPDKHVSLSSDVLPEMLEFERTSTTVINAYVAPLIETYLVRLRTKLAAAGIRAPLLVMQSNGGLISAAAAGERPVTIIESGPAAGVVAASRAAAEAGYGDVITLDMGGTTTKASIIERGAILRGSEYEVGAAVSASSRLVRGNGYLLRIPVIDISEVGAGGGSLASIDPGGALRVGPRSAGAVPGPACYGQGNAHPTVTDANLVLGYLEEGSLAGGALRVDRALAEAAITRDIVGPADLPLLDAALGIHSVANSNMVRAIKSVSVERGRDPVEFTLMAFGGAGPIHAVAVARSLGMRRVIVPPAPGVFSALGLLHAEMEHHAARTILIGTRDPALHAAQAIVDTMRAELIARFVGEGFAPDSVQITAGADLRYVGQSSEITVPLSSPTLSDTLLREAEENFEAEFARTYGHVGARKAFELVTFRLVATVARGLEHGNDWVDADAETPRGPATRLACFEGEKELVAVPVLRRGDLTEAPRPGPLLVQEYDTTIVVPPNATACRDASGNVVIEVVMNQPCRSEEVLQ
jgi:N-methylhydantoinase A